jgi:hypothetical protein
VEQPAKEEIEQYYEETEKQAPMVTTTSKMTESPTKDVTSIATSGVSPFTETYTSTTFFKKDEEDPDR